MNFFPTKGTKFSDYFLICYFYNYYFNKERNSCIWQGRRHFLWHQHQKLWKNFFLSSLKNWRGNEWISFSWGEEFSIIHTKEKYILRGWKKNNRENKSLEWNKLIPPNQFFFNLKFIDLFWILLQTLTIFFFLLMTYLKHLKNSRNCLLMCQDKISCMI